MTFSEWEGSGADATRRVAVVVDDSRIMRRKIGVVLEQQGFEVIEADNGMNGLRALNPEDPPTVVFTDLRMRVMDGVEFITRIRAIEQYAKVPILMVTGECSPQLIKRGSAAGANGMLVKPFTDDTLHKVVMGILTRQADNSAA